VAHSSALKYAIGLASKMGKCVDDHSISRFAFEYLEPQTLTPRTA
jgi:hypothetical protein